MRYFTKEWYNDTIVSEMCFQLRKSEKAAVFSEKYFEKLYSVEKKAFLKHSKRIAKFERKKFDASEAEKVFSDNYKENMDFVTSNLPQEILDDVKDIRILALGTATHDMADRIVRFCGKVNRKCEKVDRDYEESLEDLAEKLGNETINSLDSLLNAPVSSITTEDGVLTLTTSHINTGVAYKVTLTDTETVKRDDNVLDAVIIRHELVLSDDMQRELCFSLLVIDECSNLGEITIKAKSFAAEEIFD